ncbi:MAG: hypothetical protein H7Z75_21970 [Ferruginibacter sp.]|nr:hypothetical protein [Cytophagales bacterium]
MKKLLLLFAVLLTTHLTVVAQRNGDLSADSKANQTTKVKKSPPRDRDYWQKKSTVRKFKKSTKKKDCDCPGEMTAKQRRKHRFKG